MEVPFAVADVLPGYVDVMLTPGASRSTRPGAELEKAATTSLLSPVAPTLTAVEMHAGVLIDVFELSLPVAMTVAMPAAFRLSTAALRESPSQVVVLLPPPRLMFTDAMSKLDRSE